jgi:hypothetical protein
MSFALPAPRVARLKSAMGATWMSVRRTARPLSAHLAEHAYTIVGFGCISAASFIHSVFTGLLVSGFLFLIFEWKVSE